MTFEPELDSVFGTVYTFSSLKQGVSHGQVTYRIYYAGEVAKYKKGSKEGPGLGINAVVEREDERERLEQGVENREAGSPSG